MPGEAAEPTSTVVLTSKDLHYVDLRILKIRWLEEGVKEMQSPQCVQWAFAGKSRTKKDAKTGDGPGSRSHTVWDHWIDSEGNEGGTDEGDMTVLDDGTVLEEGVTLNSDGTEQKYEELWRDLPVDPLGKKQNRYSIVLRAENEEQYLKGLVIKIGAWCQGILKKNGQFTIERWQLKPKHEDENSQVQANDVEESTRTRNDWVRTFKMGTEVLACKDVCEYTTGKLGMNATKLYGERDNEIEWRVIEEYYW